ncbi:MAG: hypothetical protein AAGJ79_01940 [Verrucomicrobiota bacterium]
MVVESGALKKFLRHPAFPLFLFIFASQATGEFYPFSPFSMYSNPTPRPMRLYYLADGEGNALPMTWHSGSSPARMTKTFNRHKGGMEDADSPLPDAEIRRIAGEVVLNQLRELSLKRTKHRQLRDEIQLIELSISAGRDGLQENHKPVAKLEALPEEDAGP